MPTTTKEKENHTIEISPKELRNILSQFEPNMLTDNEETYKMKEAIQHLDKSDAIIFSLYAELESERKVADILGVSRSPIHKIIAKIKQQILTETNVNND